MVQRGARVGRPPFSEREVLSRKTRILDSALRLVATIGADGVRLRQVAADAGVSVGTVQHYFPSREALIRDAFSLHSERVIRSLSAASSAAAADPWLRIEALVHSFTDATDYLQRCALWVEFASVAVRDDELRALMTNAYSSWELHLREAIDDGVGSGRFAPIIDQDSVVLDLLALIDGYEIALAMSVASASPQAVSKRLLAVAAALLDVRPDQHDGSVSGKRGPAARTVPPKVRSAARR